jgi:hypothetical protein
MKMIAALFMLMLRGPVTTELMMIITFMCVFSGQCLAEYFAIGPFEGEVCKGFVVEVCSLETLDAIERDGKFYEINKVWEKVDSFKKGKSENIGRCYLRLNNGGAFNFLNSKPNFYQYNSEAQLVRVKVNDYVTFKCRRR